MSVINRQDPYRSHKYPLILLKRLFYSIGAHIKFLWSSDSLRAFVFVFYTHNLQRHKPGIDLELIQDHHHRRQRLAAL